MRSLCKYCQAFGNLNNEGICSDCVEEINKYSIPVELLDIFIDQTYSCCICYEEISSNSSGCSYCPTIYHSDCLNKWRFRSTKCPNCRREM